MSFRNEFSKLEVMPAPLPPASSPSTMTPTPLKDSCLRQSAVPQLHHSQYEEPSAFKLLSFFEFPMPSQKDSTLFQKSSLVESQFLRFSDEKEAQNQKPKTALPLAPKEDLLQVQRKPEKPIGHHPKHHHLLTKCDSAKTSDFEKEACSSNLTTVLKIFKGVDLDPGDIPLTEGDKLLVFSILRRKFDLKLTPAMDPNQILEEIAKIPKLHSKKRKEENRKFVFKSVIKALRKSFIEANNISPRESKKTIDEKFYRNYFEETSNVLSIELKEFFLPGSSVHKTMGTKTFTDKYIQLIKKSRKFVADFDLELKKFTEDKISYVVEKKVKKMFAKFGQMLRKNDENNVIKYVLEDKKGKLPWTKREIQEAVDCVSKSFQEQ